MKTTIVWLLLACSLCTALQSQTNYAQQKRWVLDGDRIDFTSDPPTKVIGLLPQYPTGAPLSGGINGAHNGQDLLFYIDRQNRVRDKNGTQIGSGLSAPLGGAEMCVVPVPGSSCRYFIVYLNSTQTPTTSYNTAYSTVDLSDNNNQGSLTNHLPILESILHSSGGVFAVGPLLNNDTERYLYKIGFNRGVGRFDVMKFKITAAGIAPPTIIYSVPGPTNDFHFESAEADLSQDGTMLAFANEFEVVGGSNNDVVVIHLDPNNDYNLASTAGNQGNGTSVFSIAGERFTGVEFSPFGNNLFVGQFGVGIHKIDLVGAAPISTIFDTDLYGNSQLELGYDPFGNYRIYATDGTNLRGINNPDGVSPFFSSINLVTGITASTAADHSRAYQLPDQIDGFDYDKPFNSINPTCCIVVNTFNQNTYSATANATWTAATTSSNPFNTTGTVKIQTELRIPTNRNITIQGMRFEFAPGAKLIIEAGARLTVDNSTLTSTNCQGLWQGIEVQGNHLVSQYATNPSGLRTQGHLIIKNNSLIENAKEAITLWIQPANLTATGGIVWANNSTFRNNWRCAEFMKYDNFTILNKPANNLSYFRDCIFETTLELLNHGELPYAFITMWEVDGVGIQGNTFRNTSGIADIKKAGLGIKSIDAKYGVQGYCTAPTPYGTPCPASSVVPNRFQGLTYGIDAFTLNVINTVTISNNVFDNNWRAVLLRGMDFATVKENSFNVGAPTSGTTDYESYALYTEDCSGYKIEGNSFNSTHNGTIGTYTQNSGTATNLIYRNSFNNLGIGSVAGLTNGAGTIGLEYRCNTYNTALADIVLASGAIAQNQGVCNVGTSNPAGNTFGNPFFYHLYKDPAAAPFNYYFHSTGGIYEPMIIGPGISKFSANCNPYNALADCKSTLYPNPNIVKGEKQTLSTLLTQQKSLIDGGNTALLVASLATLSPGQAKNAMMAVTPYASDAALLAYLGKNPPSGHLNQVISANSPVTTTVWSRIEQMNIPNGIKTQLTALQTGTSARAELEGSIAYYEKEIWLLTDELIRYYLNDTIVTDPMDSVLVLLKEQNRQKMKCQQLAAEIKAGKLTDADATVAAIATAQGGQITDNYCKLLSILLELEKASQSCLNISHQDEGTVRDIAADETKRGCAQAKALLHIAFHESFPETIEEIQFPTTALREAGNTGLEIHQERTQTEVQNTPENNPATALSDQIYSLNTYPNPFDKILTVNTTIPENVQNAAFILYDVLGKELKRIRLAQGASVVEINGEELQEGILYYVLILDDKIVENGKVIYLRKVSNK